MQDFSGIVHGPLLIFFSLSSVDDKHDVRNGHTRLSDISWQDNLKKTQSSLDFQDSWMYLFSCSVKLLYFIFMQDRNTIFFSKKANL